MEVTSHPLATADLQIREPRNPLPPATTTFFLTVEAIIEKCFNDRNLCSDPTWKGKMSHLKALDEAPPNVFSNDVVYIFVPIRKVRRGLIFLRLVNLFPTCNGILFNISSAFFQPALFFCLRSLVALVRAIRP